MTSQQLRHLDILLVAPWAMQLDLIGPGKERKNVLIANPTAFLTQKMLIHSRRNRGQRAKDVLYIHDTLEVFGSSLEVLGVEWELKIGPGLHPNHRKAALRAPDQLFGTMTDTIREAARMATGRQLAPESVRETCRFGLRHLFA